LAFEGTEHSVGSLQKTSVASDPPDSSAEHAIAEQDGLSLAEDGQISGSLDGSPVVPDLHIDRLTHPVFIFAYLANLTLVTANAATFIFADWVAWVAQNGSSATYHEELPGRVMQFGLFAAISARLFLGQAIDRFGVRHVWIVMSVLNLSGCLIFATLDHLSVMLFVGRILFATGLAGMFTCGTFHIQSCVAEIRRTEFIALLGSSGFVGMMAGPQLADLLGWATGHQKSEFFPAVFWMVFSLNVGYLVFVLLATTGMPQPVRRTRPHLLRLMRRHWPGLVMLVSMVMGLVFTVPSLYLVRFNRFAGFGGIAPFWTTYAITAFLFRVRTAALSRRVGRYRLIFVGLLFQGVGLWSLIPASESWHLCLSASLFGLGHALLFPSIVSLGSGTFPREYRGSGTNLTLGVLDLGSAISAPLMGRIIDLPMFDGIGYRPMFFVAGSLTLGIAAIWMVCNRGRRDEELSR
jgi:MFS family permease